MKVEVIWSKRLESFINVVSNVRTSQCQAITFVILYNRCLTQNQGALTCLLPMEEPRLAAAGTSVRLFVATTQILHNLCLQACGFVEYQDLGSQGTGFQTVRVRELFFIELNYDAIFPCKCCYLFLYLPLEVSGV